jgi:Fe-S protein assembly co-chaperone HscB
MIYFDLFNLDKTKFFIDDNQLTETFFTLQQKAHPDCADQTLFTEDLCRTINEAYKILKDPFKRAQYMIDCLSNETETTDTDQALLAEMLDYQETATPDQRITDTQIIYEDFADAIKDHNLTHARYLAKKLSYMKRFT